MSCTYECELTALMDGELDDLARHKVETHLGACAECQETTRRLGRSVAKLSALPAFEPSADLRRQVLTRLPDGRPGGWFVRRRWAHLGWALPAAAAIAYFMLVPAARSPDFKEPAQYLLASNLEVVEDYEFLGLEEPDDLEVVAHLHELEVTP